MKLRSKLNYLVQVNLRKDGRSLDLFIQNAQNQIKKIEVDCKNKITLECSSIGLQAP
jgi:hypothetical protein